MTLIEFYDEDGLENIVSFERGKYEKVIFLFFPETHAPSLREQEALRTYLLRHFDCVAKFMCVNSHAILTALSKCVQENEQFEADITGGSEQFIAACGYHMAIWPGRCMAIQQFDIPSGNRSFRYPDDGKRNVHTHVALTVYEAVSLCHSKVVQEGLQLPKGPKYDELLLRMWSAVSSIPRDWNCFSTLLNLQTERQTEYRKLISSNADRQTCEKVSAELSCKDIIKNARFCRLHNQECFAFELAIPKEMHFLMNKGGSLLEQYCTMAVRHTGVFDDCRTGVLLDWDGRITRDATDTQNEVDIVMTMGHIPVFASCKNANVRNDFLYEIKTMATHYGGCYARSAIFSTVRALPAIRKRAEDMGVVLIDQINTLSFEAFIETLKRSFESAS